MQSKAVLLSDVDVLQVAHHGGKHLEYAGVPAPKHAGHCADFGGGKRLWAPGRGGAGTAGSLDAHIFSTRENATIELSTVGDGIFSVHTARGGTT